MENGDDLQYATADEVDGIRRTLDQFMKTQEENNQKFQAGIDQILYLMSNSVTPSPQKLPEDKGSTFKDKNIPATPSSTLRAFHISIFKLILAVLMQTKDYTFPSPVHRVCLLHTLMQMAI